MQDEVFPEVLRATSGAREAIRSRYPVLDLLGLEINKFDTPSRFVRIELKPDAKYYTVGCQFTTQWTEQYLWTDDNEISWSETELKENTIEGFAICAATPNNGGGFPKPLLHILYNVTDLDMSAAVSLDDIAKLWIYSEAATEVKAMQQNAWVDGTTIRYNEMRGYNFMFIYDEIDDFVEMYWPKPQLVYERQ